mmetsp:Transcript_17774/g.24573  ORF Transcript_17774/g.24573 Transcript_17774/m.24573 type:complete len:218 (+) Transcript_17774:573-1226(+)
MDTVRVTSLWHPRLEYWNPSNRQRTPPGTSVAFIPGHCFSSSCWQDLSTRGLNATKRALLRAKAVILFAHIEGNSGNVDFSCRQVMTLESPGCTLGQCVEIASEQTFMIMGFSLMSSASCASNLASAAWHSGETSWGTLRKHSCTRPSPAGIFLQSFCTSSRQASAKGRSSFQLSAALVSMRVVAILQPGLFSICLLSLRHLMTLPLPGSMSLQRAC